MKLYLAFIAGILFLAILQACVSNPYKNSDTVQEIALTTCKVGSVGAKMAARMWNDPQLTERVRTAAHDTAQALREPIYELCEKGKEVEHLLAADSTEEQLTLALGQLQKELDDVVKPPAGKSTSLLDDLTGVLQ